MSRQALRKTLLKKIFGSRTFLFLVSLALIALTISLTRETYHKYQLSQEINRLEEEIERLEGNNRQLGNLMNYLQEDSYAEKEARLKFNLKKPGEKVIIFSDNSDQNESNEQSGSGLLEGVDDSLKKNINGGSEKTPNYWKWWEYFFAS